MDPSLPSDLEHGYVSNGDVKLHVVQAGPKDGHLVLLLHGFPSFWITWKHQIGPLAERGFHVVAPDLRGYNDSSKPTGVGSYGRTPVLSDISALINNFAGEDGTATLVGHDWGGNIAWCYAHDFPERVRRLVVLNAPHPSSFSKALRTDWGQMKRSWYIFVFQVATWGEDMMTRNEFSFLRKIIREDPVRPQSEALVQAHVDAFSKEGAMSASINYYRAILRHWGSARHKQVSTPVLVLWGEKDYVFQPYLVDPPPEVVLNSTVIRFPNASHWVMWDEPEAVTGHILAFLSGAGETTGRRDSLMARL